MRDVFFLLTGALMLLGAILLWGSKNPQYKNFKNSEGKPKRVNMVLVWCYYVALVLVPVWMVVAYLLSFQQ